MSSENFRKLAQTSKIFLIFQLPIIEITSFKMNLNLEMKIQQDSFLNKKQQCSFSFLLCLLESSHHEIQNLFQVEVK